LRIFLVAPGKPTSFLSSLLPEFETLNLFDEFCLSISHMACGLGSGRG
jgi:hypothetical protein